MMMCSCRQEVVIKPEPIVPLYKGVAAYAGEDSVARAAFLHKDSVALSAMLRYMMPEGDAAAQTERLSESDAVLIFTPAVDSVFPRIEPLEKTLGHILHRAKADSLDLPGRTYAAVVWGKTKSIVNVDMPHDSVMLIALNHYLGADYPGYSHWPVYMRASKTPRHLPYDIVEALVASRYPYPERPGQTVLSRMVYEGVLALAKIELVPDGNISEALGYTESELQWLGENETKIWNMIVERDILYDTSLTMAEALVAPSPYVSVLGHGVPGRVGRYIGYRIVRAYMKQNTRTCLRDMLSPDFYDNTSVLVEAAYSGQ